jgi:tetrahydromethanopterin S-methyltransferase subunit B
LDLVNPETITASQFAARSNTIEAAGLTVGAAFGFMPGLMLELRKG